MPAASMRASSRSQTNSPTKSLDKVPATSSTPSANSKPPPARKVSNATASNKTQASSAARLGSAKVSPVKASVTIVNEDVTKQVTGTSKPSQPVSKTSDTNKPATTTTTTNATKPATTAASSSPSKTVTNSTANNNHKPAAVNTTKTPDGLKSPSKDKPTDHHKISDTKRGSTSEPSKKKEPEFTPEQISEFRQAFHVFDKDGDGTISVKELGIVMRSLGQNPNDEELRVMIDEVDTDGSGCIEFPEFMELMAKKMLVVDEEEQIREAFKVFDPKNVGYITSKELKRIMTKFGDKLSEEEAEELLAEADFDNNGLIECEEFVKMMLNH